MFHDASHSTLFWWSVQAKKKELSRLNRELSKAQAELNRQKRLRDDMGPQHIKLKESITTLKRQVCICSSICPLKNCNFVPSGAVPFGRSGDQCL